MLTLFNGFRRPQVVSLILLLLILVALIGVLTLFNGFRRPQVVSLILLLLLLLSLILLLTLRFLGFVDCYERKLVFNNITDWTKNT